ncbi:peptidase C14, caspase catalytic subunit p20 [Leisingera sp. ANG-Vp]|nr:peptidase C14, caspase catalytic subunit p20 [Leisingera sp. ANG-Vp]
MKILSSLAGLLLATMAWAEPRIALVIGNSAYDGVAPLDNPVNDARLMSVKLAELGFDVTRVTDGSQIQMKRAIAQFGRKLRSAGKDATGLFYYAGHGVQSFGANYLLPTDIALSDAADLDLLAIEAKSVLHQMASAQNTTNIVILDACRDNPFQGLPGLDDNGLAEMKAPVGTFLAYSTEPGGVALDGETGNSPFTASLASHLTAPGLPVEQLFKRVRVEVLQQTSGLQIPWDTSSLVRNFAFMPQLEPIDAQAEALAWQTVSAARDAVQLMLFLRAYPKSSFEPEARSLLQTVIAETMHPSAPPAPVSPPPPAGQPGQAAQADEQAIFDMAALDDTVGAYQMYLDSYPQGSFAAKAADRIAALQQTRAEARRQAMAQQEAEAPVPVSFTSRLLLGNQHVRGQSIADLLQQSPQFPPVPDLPDAAWKEKTCASCHKWTPETLCAQARTYIGRPAAVSLVKEHPFGGGLKVNLRQWAVNGCRQ